MNSFRQTTENIKRINNNLYTNKLNPDNDKDFCPLLFNSIHTKINTTNFPPSQFPYITKRRTLNIKKTGGKKTRRISKYQHKNYHSKYLKSKN